MNITNDELFDEYIEQNKLRNTEGPSGVRNLETICRTLGYGRNGAFVGDWPLQNFLADNPGAIEAIHEFIANWVPRNDEWADNLREMIEDDSE